MFGVRTDENRGLRRARFSNVGGRRRDTAVGDSVCAGSRRRENNARRPRLRCRVQSSLIRSLSHTWRV